MNRKVQRVIFLTLSLGLVSACSPRIDDLIAYTQQVKATTTAVVNRIRNLISNRPLNTPHLHSEARLLVR